jgi:hypothetical protein
MPNRIVYNRNININLYNYGIMKLRDLKQAIDRVYASNNNPDDIEVCIPNNKSGYGGTSVTLVIGAHKGFDWDKGKFMIYPEYKMTETIEKTRP